MDWCCSSTPRTPEYRTMNEERHARKAYWLVIVRLQFLTGVDTKGLRPSILWIEGQNFWFFHVVKELNNGFFVLSKSWTMKIDGECLIELIRSCRNKVQVYRSVRMPQLHTSLHFHLTPIVMINGRLAWPSLEFSKLLSLHPRRGGEPVAVSAVLPEALGKSE